MPYQTKQQQAVLRLLKERREEAVTAAELAEALRRSGCPVGLATVYRQLERLERAGSVHRVETAEGALYQYCARAGGGRDCFLLKCRRCGRIRHLDCSHLQALYGHLEAEHRFRVDPRGTLFQGLCAACAQAEEKEEDGHGTE